MSQANEWELIKRQFETRMHDENVGAESIDEILDVQFRHLLGWRSKKKAASLAA